MMKIARVGFDSAHGIKVEADSDLLGRCQQHANLVFRRNTVLDIVMQNRKVKGFGQYLRSKAFLFSLYSLNQQETIAVHCF